jgi:hypothetical protein
VVATGEAAFAGEDQTAESRVEAPPSRIGQLDRIDTLRWAIAIAGLVIVAVGMIAALRGISTL